MEERKEREKRERVYKRINHREVPAGKHRRHPAAPPHPARLRAGGRTRWVPSARRQRHPVARGGRGLSVGTRGAVHACPAPARSGACRREVTLGDGPFCFNAIRFRITVENPQTKTCPPAHSRANLPVTVGFFLGC